MFNFDRTTVHHLPSLLLLNHRMVSSRTKESLEKHEHVACVQVKSEIVSKNIVQLPHNQNYWCV